MVCAAEAWSTTCSSSSSSSLVGQVVEVLEVLDVEVGGDGPTASSTRLLGLHLRAAAQQLLLLELGLEALAAALERLVDRLGRRGEAALQRGEREADDDAPRVPRPRSLASRSARFISSRT